MTLNGTWFTQFLYPFRIPGIGKSHNWLVPNCRVWYDTRTHHPFSLGTVLFMKSFSTWDLSVFVHYSITVSEVAFFTGVSTWKMHVHAFKWRWHQRRQYVRLRATTTTTTTTKQWLQQRQQTKEKSNKKKTSPQQDGQRDSELFLHLLVSLHVGNKSDKVFLPRLSYKATAF